MENISTNINIETYYSTTHINTSTYIKAIEATLNLLPRFRTQIPTCKAFLNGSQTDQNNQKALKRAKNWKFNKYLFKNQLLEGSFNR